VPNRLRRRDDGSFVIAAGAVLGDRLLDCIEQILTPNRFGPELDRTGPNRHRHIGMAADEDNRQAKISPGQLLLKIEPASPGQSHIEHKVGGSVRTDGRAEFIHRSEQLADRRIGAGRRSTPALRDHHR